ncbi:MAG: 30S ribosomal protein S6 [Candidatus Saganbacteria bacterium]|nr:30S ribosomal protein S6 [Candidatus Saganbacteria bacterium]
MKHYDALFIVNPRIAPEKVDVLLERLQKRVTDNGGEIVKVTKQGIRRLAFTFSKHKKLKEGLFVLVEYKGIGKTSESVMAWLRLQEEIIRFMVTIKEIETNELEVSIVPEEASSAAKRPAPVKGDPLRGQS